MSIAAAPALLISVAQLRKLLNFGPNDDNELKNAEINAIMELEAWVGRLFASRTGHEWIYRAAQPRSTLYVGIIPLTTITSVEYAANGKSWAGASVLVEDTNFYIVDNSRGQVEAMESSLASRSMFEKGNYRFTVDAGYTTDDLPEDIRQAIILQTQFYIERNTKVGGNMISSSKALPEGGSVSMFTPKNIHPQAQQNMNRYRQYWR